MTMPGPTGDPLAGTLDSYLARLHAEELGGVGVPGELFLDTWPEMAIRAVPDPSAADLGGLELPDGPRAVRAGTLSAVDAVEFALDRIRATDPLVQAWARVDDRAGQAAMLLDEEFVRGAWRGTLHGMPVGIKDLVDVVGLPTAAGSRHWSGPDRRIAETDAGVVALLRSAGAVVLGKTTTHEFAFGGTTSPTRNPHDLHCIPGGSSGGSAAAIAAGHVRLAVGTDTCGSVRIPSSYCGTVGFLPSVGQLPRDGVVPLAWSLDRVGLLTSDVVGLAWAAWSLGLVTRPPARRAAAGSALRGLQVGIPHDALDEPIAPGVVARFQDAVDRLAWAGVRTQVVDVRPSPTAVAAGLAIFLAESLDFHRERWARRPGLFGDDVRATLTLAEQLSGADYVRAQRIRRALRDEMVSVFAGVDLLLTPTMPSGAPSARQARTGVLSVGGTDVSLADAHLRYNVVANLAALPAGTQPMGLDERRMPLGLHWMGPHGSDERILAAMVAFESLTSQGKLSARSPTAV